MVDKNIANFLYEMGTLKNVQRSGWWLINIKDPESVADHSFRATMIAFLLAKIENADAYKAAAITLFHDTHESRLNDMHKVGARYLNTKPAQEAAQKEQLSTLGKTGKEIFKLFEEYENQQSPEAIIARDADLLECYVQAREYMKIGYTDAQKWINNINKLLITESAKQLAKQLDKTDPNDWWAGLKKSVR